MRIHQLPAATSVAETDKIGISQSDVTKHCTVQQMRAPRVSVIEDTATMNINVTGLDHITINPLSQNTTINLTGGVPGQKYTLLIQQDGTGNRTVTLGGNVIYGATLTSYTATTAANKIDMLGFIVGLTSAQHLLVAVSKGF